ncbi:ATP-dependent DNA helicase RecG [Nocardioides bigeumensis]|uniref:Probable DNA 3'-5' helicase RecG n=1 Tax=Nocardioides bigeumensis TaxID=433657 RepID=A0ABN2XT38_9ACTN
MITLDSPIATLIPDQAKKRTKVADGLGLKTVGDLMRHFPRRYLKTSELTAVAELEEGQLLTVVGEISHSDLKTYRDRRSGRMAYRLETVLRTDGPSLQMSFFAQKKHVADYHQRQLAVGAKGLFTGQVSRFRDRWQLTNPKMFMFGKDPDQDSEALEVQESIRGLYPIYPLTKGIDTWDLQRAVTFARGVLDDVPDVVPADLRVKHGLPDARTALDWIHAPEDYAQVTSARKRYRYEEALVTQLVLARRRAFYRQLGGRPCAGGQGGLLAAFDARLPWPLTDGQREVSETIFEELGRSWPMNRLLQGEVGSGKTVVAVRAMLRAIDSGAQAALLAPTEVLAQQHHRSITALLGDLAAGGMLGGAEEATTVTLLTGSMSTTQRKQALLDIASGQAGIVVGTHALLEERVQFVDLGLVVVDEQHRFGVEQRAALADKALMPPHVLVMTATPIPRTVAMTVFGDLEVSTLTELPSGRAPIQTNVVPLDEHPEWIARVWGRVREEVEKGHQVYVVCPRITGDQAEQGERDEISVDADGNAVPPKGTLAAVTEVAVALHDGPLSGLRVAVLHGQLAPEEKDRTMRDFAAGRIDVLVATTVIEVGIDVANATAMVLLDADRFGVSQLHQLRGRVGRGGLPGLCLLVTHAENGSAARERVDAVAASSDGFELSRVDLELRREGDVLGASQSGFRSGLQNLRVLRDEDTIVAAREDSIALLEADPGLDEHPLLRTAVDELEQSSQSGFMEKS